MFNKKLQAYFVTAYKIFITLSNIWNKNHLLSNPKYTLLCMAITSKLDKIWRGYNNCDADSLIREAWGHTSFSHGKKEIDAAWIHLTASIQRLVKWIAIEVWHDLIIKTNPKENLWASAFWQAQMNSRN